MSIHKLFAVLAMSLCVAPLTFARLSPADLTVLDAPADTMMESYLTGLVEGQFARRDSLLEELTTAAAWNRHADYIRREFRRWTGEFPPRTPLNAEVTGVLERDGYRVEKIHFQSRPGFFVSANLYLPAAGDGPFPAIVNVIGHALAGKASSDVQHRCIGQARKGFAALAIDAVGQGERSQEEYLVFGRSPGSLHQRVGFQAFLSGWHVFSIMAWDLIRAIDYLETRPEVDMSRVGITGTSGGGMMTTYILPLEDRIAAAVPACNPNTWLARVRAGLSTDHEQVFFGAFARNIDPRGDPLMCLAPRPLLINATSRDNLNPPMGVWTLHSWLYRQWASHGAPEKLHTSMVDAPHDYNRDQREVAYAWFLRWLGGESDAGWVEGEVRIEPDSALWAAPGGDVMNLPEARDPWSLVRDYFDSHWPRFDAAPGGDEFAELVRREVRAVTGIERNPAAPAVDRLPVRWTGEMRLAPLLFRPEAGIVLPAVLIEPRRETESVLLYVDEDGKRSLAGGALAVEQLLENGSAVLAVDLRGQGETAPGLEGRFWDFLAGESIPAARVRDILAVLAWARQEYPGAEIRIRALGADGLWAALAALLDGGVTELHLRGAPVDFADMIETRLPRYGNELILPGVLERLDMKQVYQALCPARITLADPLRADRTPAAEDWVAERLADVERVYESKDAGGRWRISIGGR